jgi:magnesium-protoporphyrin O-methyltransferase
VNCSSHCGGIDEIFDATLAKRELAKYRKTGPRRSTRRLLDSIRKRGIGHATVLDIGGGVGAIAHALLGGGATRATIVDASAAHLAAAREEKERRGVGAQLELVRGDFVSLAADVAVADIVTLDKVICCYPDMQQLIEASTGRARRLYGITYPRDAWWVRVVIAAQNAVRRARHCAFQVYVYSNAAIDAAVQHTGFTRVAHERGVVWAVALYERTGAASDTNAP